METFWISLAIFAVVAVLLSVGALFGRRLKGSCGGQAGCACSPEERAACNHGPGEHRPVTLGRRTRRRMP